MPLTAAIQAGGSPRRFSNSYALRFKSSGRTPAAAAFLAFWFDRFRSLSFSSTSEHRRHIGMLLTYSSVPSPHLLHNAINAPICRGAFSRLDAPVDAAMALGLLLDVSIAFRREHSVQSLIKFLALSYYELAGVRPGCRARRRPPFPLCLAFPRICLDFPRPAGGPRPKVYACGRGR